MGTLPAGSGGTNGLFCSGAATQCWCPLHDDESSMDERRAATKVAGRAVCAEVMTAPADDSTDAGITAMLPMPTAFGGITISVLSE